MESIVIPKHPGVILQEYIDKAQMTRKELAVRTGVTEKHLSTVINGEKGISAAFARKLSYVFPSTKMWLDLQSDYDAYQQDLKSQNDISDEEIAILSDLKEIVMYFIEHSIMHNNCGDAEKIMQLRNILNVSNLTSIPNITYNAAYRAQVSNNAKVNPYVLFCWQRLCELETTNRSIGKDLDVITLQSKLQDIRLCMFDKVNDGIEHLASILSDCGIVLHVAKNFRGAPVQGFIKSTLDNKLILCLTIRRKRADIFWFTLFHEIAHILNGDFSTRFVDFESTETAMEAKANQFARDILINPVIYKDFIQNTAYFTWSEIEKFAKAANVMPFIVLGRLQNDNILDWSEYSSKVVYYKWA